MLLQGHPQLPPVRRDPPPGERHPLPSGGAGPPGNPGGPGAVLLRDGPRGLQAGRQRLGDRPPSCGQLRTRNRTQPRRLHGRAHRLGP